MKLDYQSIGIRVRRFRKKRDLTQQALAELSNQEPSNISHIERGATKLSLPTIVSLANALNVTVDDLLCDSLVACETPYMREVEQLMSDCSHEERRILSATLQTLKEQLRKRTEE